MSNTIGRAIKPASKERIVAHDLSSLMHDLRGMANIVQASTEALVAAPLAANHRELAEVALFGAKNMIDFLADFSGDGDPFEQSSPFDLLGLLMSFQKAFQIRIGQQAVQVVAEIDPTLQQNMASGAAVALQKILLNLLDNALRFCPKGLIHLSAFPAVGRSGWIIFEVSDTGTGIEKKNIDQIFEPFWQPKNQKKGGVGLGLSIVRHLTETQGGKVKVTSRVGAGSSFSVELPFVLTPKSVAIPSNRPLRPDVENELEGRSALIVDDSELSQRLHAHLLKSWKCTFECVGNAADAVERAHKKAFDLILIDYRLPDMNGSELAQQLRSSALSKPLIVSASGLEMSSNAEQYFDLCLRKPISSTVLHAGLRGLLKKRNGPSIGGNLAPALEVDWSHLLDFCAGDRLFALEIVEMFLQDAPTAFGQLLQAAQSRERVRCCQLAHRLKSNFLTIGLLDLEQAAAELEALCSGAFGAGEELFVFAENLVEQAWRAMPLIQQKMEELR